MSNRQWIDEVLDYLQDNTEGYRIDEAYIIDGALTNAKATINQKINQEFEELLESLPKEVTIEELDNSNKHLDSRTFQSTSDYNRGMIDGFTQVRTLIKAKIKDKNGNS